MDYVCRSDVTRVRSGESLLVIVFDGLGWIEWHSFVGPLSALSITLSTPLDRRSSSPLSRWRCWLCPLSARPSVTRSAEPTERPPEWLVYIQRIYWNVYVYSGPSYRRYYGLATSQRRPTRLANISLFFRCTIISRRLYLTVRLKTYSSTPIAGPLPSGRKSQRRLVNIRLESKSHTS